MIVNNHIQHEGTNNILSIYSSRTVIFGTGVSIITHWVTDIISSYCIIIIIIIMVVTDWYVWVVLNLGMVAMLECFLP